MNSFENKGKRVMENIPRNKKRRSQVWKHFQIIGTDRASCNWCTALLHFRGSTFNLKRHLENKHKEIDLPMLKISKLKQTVKYEKEDSEDSFFWEESGDKIDGGEPIEDTHDIILDSSNHSIINELDEHKDGVRVVSFDFQDFKNEYEHLNGHDKNEPTHNFDVKIERVTTPPKKTVKRSKCEIEDNEFKETQIFGDFVASQLRILSKKKREKLQILIQKAILDVICEDPDVQSMR